VGGVSLFVAHGNYECSVIVIFALQCYFRLYLKY